MKYSIDLGIRPPGQTDDESRAQAVAHLRNKTVIRAYPREEYVPKFAATPRDLWWVETDEPE